MATSNLPLPCWPIGIQLPYSNQTAAPRFHQTLGCQGHRDEESLLQRGRRRGLGGKSVHIDCSTRTYGPASVGLGHWMRPSPGSNRGIRAISSAGSRLLMSDVFWHMLLLLSVGKGRCSATSTAPRVNVEAIMPRLLVPRMEEVCMATNMHT